MWPEFSREAEALVLLLGEKGARYLVRLPPEDLDAEAVALLAEFSRLKAELGISPATH